MPSMPMIAISRSMKLSHARALGADFVSVENDVDTGNGTTRSRRAARLCAGASCSPALPTRCTAFLWPGLTALGRLPVSPVPAR